MKGYLLSAIGTKSHCIALHCTALIALLSADLQQTNRQTIKREETLCCELLVPRTKGGTSGQPQLVVLDRICLLGRIELVCSSQFSVHERSKEIAVNHSTYI